jgi:hypothetical protein
VPVDLQEIKLLCVRIATEMVMLLPNLKQDDSFVLFMYLLYGAKKVKKW